MNEWIKRRKKETGARRIQDVLALSPDHDPFNIGTAAHRERAEWFAALWEEHYKGQTGIHLRRIHYRLVSIQAQKPHCMQYGNTKLDWIYLQLAAMYARILFPDRVPPDAFEDRRNDQPHSLTWSGDPSALVEPFVLGPNPSAWTIPSLRVDLTRPDWLLGTPSVYGYSRNDFRDRAYYVELWIEKTTMNDILIPLTEELGVRLITSSGFQSVTNAVKLLERVKEMGKPARILYVSDYDKSGRHMPVSAGRHIEFWRKRYAPESEVKLRVVALTQAQIDKYKLPTNAESDGSVELDALEAIVPGELEEIVRQAVEPYFDETIDERLECAKQMARAIVEDEWPAVTEPYKARRKSLQKRVDAITKKYRKQADALNKRMKDDLLRFEKPLALLKAELGDAVSDFNPKLPERPKPFIVDLDESKLLFDSSRSYDQQLAFYKRASEQ